MRSLVRGEWRTHLDRLLRFGLAGCAGFVIDFTVLVVCRSGIGLALWASTAAAYAVGASVHYALTRYWVFPHERGPGELGKVIRYVLLGGTNALVTIAVVVSLSGLGLDYRLAKLVAVAGLFLSNYVLVPRVVFRTQPPR